MSHLGTAIKIAAQVHEGQTDKADAPYILHCLAVMQAVEQHGEGAQIVAVLHDTLEDAWPLDRPRIEHEIRTSFDYFIFEALSALTHQPDETYDDYIERVAQNYLARLVKIADLTHNMDPRRIPAYQIVDKDFKRWDKYRRALIRLEREP